jgi:hypothetical protein
VSTERIGTENRRYVQVLSDDIRPPGNRHRIEAARDGNPVAARDVANNRGKSYRLFTGFLCLTFYAILGRSREWISSNYLDDINGDLKIGFGEVLRDLGKIAY